MLRVIEVLVALLLLIRQNSKLSRLYELTEFLLEDLSFELNRIRLEYVSKWSHSW